MKVKIAKWGNSLAVRLPKKLAEELGLAPGKTVELERKGSETAALPKVPYYRLEDLLAQIKPGDKPPPFEDWVFCHQSGPIEDWSDIAPTDEEMGVGNADGKRRRAGRR